MVKSKRGYQIMNAVLGQRNVQYVNQNLDEILFDLMVPVLELEEEIDALCSWCAQIAFEERVKNMIGDYKGVFLVYNEVYINA